MTDLEKRLANTERTLVALWALMKDTAPPEYREGIDRMMEEYFDVNTNLGAAFSEILIE